MQHSPCHVVEYTVFVFRYEPTVAPYVSITHVVSVHANRNYLSQFLRSCKSCWFYVLRCLLFSSYLSLSLSLHFPMFLLVIWNLRNALVPNDSTNAYNVNHCQCGMHWHKSPSAKIALRLISNWSLPNNNRTLFWAYQERADNLRVWQWQAYYFHQIDMLLI